MRYLLGFTLLCLYMQSWAGDVERFPISKEYNANIIKENIRDLYLNKENRIITGTTLPTTGYSAGRLFFNTTNNRMYYSTQTVTGTYSWKQF